MNTFRSGPGRAATLVGLVAPAAAAAIMVPWRTSMPNQDAALVMVVVVVAVAAYGHRIAGFLAAASAAVWFDFFLTQPYERLTINRPTDLATTLLLLTVGVAVTELAVRGRRFRFRTATSSSYLAALHSTAELVADGMPAAAVVEHVTPYLVAFLGLRSCDFEPGTHHDHPPRLQPDGRVTWGETTWDIEQYGLPSDPVELPVRGHGQTLGRFMLTGVLGVTPSPQSRRVAVMLADHVGASLPHAHAPLR